MDKEAKAAMSYYTVWVNDAKDTLCSAGGLPGRRHPAGNSGTEIGHELDVTLLWNLDVHSSVLTGYSHFRDSNLIVRTGVSEDADLFYVQYGFDFQ